MSVTTVDDRTALVVIDLQKGIVAIPTATPAAEIVHRAASLAKAFRDRELPVFLVNVAGSPPGRTQAGGGGGGGGDFPSEWIELVPELDRQSSDHTITKLQWGAFYGTALELHLRRLGVTQIVLAGIATSVGVESTAREAYERGYNVTLAVDAMTDFNPAAHQNSVEAVFPALGETGTTQDVLDLICAR